MGVQAKRRLPMVVVVVVVVRLFVARCGYRMLFRGRTCIPPHGPSTSLQLCSAELNRLPHSANWEVECWVLARLRVLSQRGASRVHVCAYGSIT